MPYWMCSVNSASPLAGRPEDPIGFGVPQVPEASITWEATSSRGPVGVSTRIKNGISSLPLLTTLSSPSLEISVTRWLNQTCSVMDAANGSR